MEPAYRKTLTAGALRRCIGSTSREGKEKRAEEEGGQERESWCEYLGFGMVKGGRGRRGEG